MGLVRVVTSSWWDLVIGIEFFVGLIFEKFPARKFSKDKSFLKFDTEPRTTQYPQSGPDSSKFPLGDFLVVWTGLQVPLY